MEGKEVEFSNTMTLLSLSSSSHEVGGRLVREKRLYGASVSGNVASLKELMKEDGLTLSRVSLTCFDETPLHIASMQGHAEFARALLSYKQDLVSDLDSLGQSPLHKASANGYIEIVKMLLDVDSSACLVRDGNGWTPLHLAAMKGRVEVVKELVQARPEVTQLRTGRDETVLHLCVMHNRFEALTVLLDLSKDEDFVNAKGDGGNSILHVATALKQVETIKYLLKKTPVKVNAVNENDACPLDIIEHMPGDLKDMEICELLEKSGGLRFKKLPSLARSTHYHECNSTQIENEISPTTATEECPNLSVAKPHWWLLKDKFKWDLKKNQEDKESLKNQCDALMIVATVIASMAYQAGINPPSGVWNEDIREDPNDQASAILYYAGTSIMAANYNVGYSLFCTANALSFVASLSVMFLFVSGLPLEKRTVKWILMASMWVAIASMAFTHILSLQAIAPFPRNEGVAFVVRILMFVWLALIGIVYLRHACHLVSKVYKRYKKNKSTNETTQGRV